MTIPKQNQFNHAILEIADGRREVLSYKNFIEVLTERFSLNDRDLQELIKDGRQTVVYNFTVWAAGDLKRAGLLDSPRAGRFQINLKGREYLRTQGNTSTSQLRKLRRLQESQQNDPEEATTPDLPFTIEDPVVGEEVEVNPDEQIASAVSELRIKLTDEMLDTVRRVSPTYFERIVVDLLEKMGYGEGEVTQVSRDGGIDGIINQDPLGLEKVYIQAKRWQNQVGEPEIRNFSGSLDTKGASKGVFITTSSFNPAATEAAHTISAGQKFIRLIDGAELTRLMIDHDVGVVHETTYVIKKLDENYFADDI